MSDDDWIIRAAPDVGWERQETAFNIGRRYDRGTEIISWGRPEGRVELDPAVRPDPFTASLILPHGLAVPLGMALIGEALPADAYLRKLYEHEQGRVDKLIEAMVTR